MQVVFADPHSDWATPGFADILPAIERLIEAHEQVVFTRFVAPEAPWGAWVDYYRRWPFALRAANDPMWDLVDTLPSAGQVVSGPGFGKWGPELADATGSAEELLLAGVSTDCCVLSTALAAADAGRRVTVVADACAGLSPADHQRALDAMALYAPLITVSSVAEVLA